MAKTLPLGLLLLSLGVLGFAQQAGLKDFSTTESRVPAEHVPSPSSDQCPTVNSQVSNGSQVPSVGSEVRQDNIEFTIAQVSPLHIGGIFTATVRLKNPGPKRLLIPWETDGERVTRLSKDQQEESYEAADIALILKSSVQPRPVWLQATAVLFAHPELKSSYLEVPPGQWADLKLSGKMECTEEGLPCTKIVPDKNALLSAWWYQRQLTHKVHECNDDHGTYVIRELESKPLPVVVQGERTSPAPPVPSHKMLAGLWPF